jgi:hypothetical protein
MCQILSSRITISVFCVLGLLVCGVQAEATDISRTILTTLTITEDSQLVGDVTCEVPLTMPGANPCISFGADHITLRLNGHTITGPITFAPPTPTTGCSLTTDSKYGVGILANNRTDVKIEGPGIIQYFERWGILLSSSSQVTVKKVTVFRNCWSGMQTGSVSDSTFEENVFASDAGGSNGASCGGT